MFVKVLHLRMQSEKVEATRIFSVVLVVVAINNKTLEPGKPNSIGGRS